MRLLSLSSFRPAAIAFVAALYLANPPASVYAQNAGRNPNTALQAADSSQGAAARHRLALAYGKLPISFELNRGQADSAVQFLARGTGFTLFLTPADAVIALRAPQRLDHDGLRTLNQPAPGAKTSFLELRLVGANLKAVTSGEQLLPGISNYFNGSDPARWKTDVPAYARVRYREIYPGIDLVYYGNQEGELEHDFVVSPGANPDAIVLASGGATGISIDDKHGLTLKTRSSDFVLHPPVVYQEVEGQRCKIEARYELAANQQIHFKLGAYDRSKPLIIDPVLSHSAVFGGSRDDIATAIAVDQYGQAYITGFTYSTNFPLKSPFQSSWTPVDSTADTATFVTKINPAGTAIVYSTYLGGPRSGGTSIAVDSSQRAYVAGYTAAGFPLKNAYQPAFGGGSSDGFVTILSAAGNSLVYSSYLGGNEQEFIEALARDASGNIFVTGRTEGGFPSLHTLKAPGTPGIFVAKMNSAGALQYSVMYGNVLGTSTAITVDSAGAAYIAGYDNVGTTPITSSAVQKTCPKPSCGFVAKISPSGTTLDYSTYLGNNDAAAKGIALDSDRNAYVAGESGPGLKVSSTAFQKSFAGGSYDGFVSKINPAGSALIWSTYLGGKGDDVIQSLAIDKNRTVYVAGYTCSSNFPQKASIQAWVGTANSPCQFFVTTLSGSLNTVQYYSTYFGTGIRNPSTYLALDESLNVYLTGIDAGNVKPTKGAITPATPNTTTSSFDVFASKLDIEDDIVFHLSASAGSVSQGDYLTYTLTATSNGPDFGSNVLIDDTVPAGTVFVSADAGGGACKLPTPGGLGALNCTLPQLNKGASWTVLFRVKVTAPAGASIYNGAGAGASTQDFNLNNNVVVMTIPVK